MFRCVLVVVGCLLFVFEVCCLFVVCALFVCCLFVVCLRVVCLLFVLFVVCRALRVVCCSWFVVCCLLFVVCGMLYVCCVSYLLFDVFGVWCSLFACLLRVG